MAPKKVPSSTSFSKGPKAASSGNKKASTSRSRSKQARKSRSVSKSRSNPKRNTSRTKSRAKTKATSKSARQVLKEKLTETAEKNCPDDLSAFSGTTDQQNHEDSERLCKGQAKTKKRGGKQKSKGKNEANGSASSDLQADAPTALIAPEDYEHIYNASESDKSKKKKITKNKDEEIPDDAPTVLKELVQKERIAKQNGTGENGEENGGCCGCCTITWGHKPEGKSAISNVLLHQLAIVWWPIDNQLITNW